MSVDFSETLVIGISSRALFDLERENEIFEDQDLAAYRGYQIEHEEEPPARGIGFHLIQCILKLNQYREAHRPPLVEVVILSRNDAGIGLRIFNGIKTHGLADQITRAVFTCASGTSPADYLEAYQVDLFLSKNRDDVQAALNAGYAAMPPTWHRLARSLPRCYRHLHICRCAISFLSLSGILLSLNTNAAAH